MFNQVGWQHSLVMICAWMSSLLYRFWFLNWSKNRKLNTCCMPVLFCYNSCIHLSISLIQLVIIVSFLTTAKQAYEKCFQNLHYVERHEEHTIAHAIQTSYKKTKVFIWVPLYSRHLSFYIYVFFINLNLLLVISMACANNDGHESRESCQNNLALSRVQEHQIKGAFLFHRFCVPWVQFWFINHCFGPNSAGDWFEEFIQHGEGSFEGLECGELSELMTNNE